MYKILRAVGLVLILYDSLMSFYYIEAIARLSSKMFVDVSLRVLPILIAGLLCWACASLHEHLTAVEKSLLTFQEESRDNIRRPRSGGQNEL